MSIEELKTLLAAALRLPERPEDMEAMHRLLEMVIPLANTVIELEEALRGASESLNAEFGGEMWPAALELGPLKAATP